MTGAVRQNLTVGDILAEAQRLAMSALPALVVYLSVLTIGGMYVDQAESFAGPNLLVNIASVALMYWYVVSMLQSGGLVPEGLKNGFGTYFGISLLSGIGIVIGIVALIIPGIVLAVRWSPLYGFALGDGEDLSGAFSKSWQSTREHFFTILIAMAIPVGLYVVAFGILFAASDEMGMIDLLPSAIFNLLLWIAAATSGAIGIAVYALLRDESSQLAEVFE